MIERTLVNQRLREFRIQEFITENLRHVGHSHTKVQRTPLGEKIIIYASRPGLIVGRKGQNIKNLTQVLKKRFNLENPEIEIQEVEQPDLDATIVAERIANTLERFGPSQFKGVGHKTMAAVMEAGALGVEVLISGKIPSQRSKNWRFYSGYLKKCGDIALTGVRTAVANAKLKSGTVGIKVRIMPPDTVLPDKVELLKVPLQVEEEISDKEAEKEIKAKEKPVEEKKAKKPAAEKREAPVAKKKE
ncbi:MAG: 30S ribosomal protein S3 [archaeon]